MSVSLCPRCNKRVFFAERKTSLGKDWHRQCLTCKSCSKVLNPGQHSEHQGVPYCDVPCYKSLFGPTLYGHGSTVESHQFKSSPQTERRSQSNGKPDLNVVNNNQINISMNSPRIDGRAPKLSQLQLVELQGKLEIHNEAHPNSYISLIQKDQQVTLEGPLRVHWGVQTGIRFKMDDSSESTPFTKRLSRRRRKMAKTNSFHNDPDVEKLTEKPRDPFQTLKSAGIPPETSSQQLLAVKMKRGQFHTVREHKITRRCSINGHYYKTETSDNFTPDFGSVTNVFVGSHHKSVEVIRRLVDKFKIENHPELFALYLVKPNGEMWPLEDSKYPLVERIELKDPSARIFLMDKPHQLIQQTPENLSNPPKPTNTTSKLSVWKPVEGPEEKIPQEIASYIVLPGPMLCGFITMFNEEQEEASHQIREKYEKIRVHMKQLMIEKQFTQETYL